ncbi:MAG: KAP family NTPase [Clostridia bacterium]|jgi:hypothetical protein|nr:KAP family NTPase [Clostridia bacterium]
MLFTNKPIENLKYDNDYFNILPKAEIISVFLNKNQDKIKQKEIKMISLYGNWGSGKTTLMKFLDKDTRSNYKTIFFEAWELERDSDITLSLLEKLADEITGNTKVKFELKRSWLELKELSKEIVYNTKIKSPIVDSLEIDFGAAVKNAYEKVSEEYEKKSLFKAREVFKEKFAIIESKTKKKSILIFVDDLDRCSPENTLKLLTDIKLFFTLGSKTIFFVGLDKQAVSKAVQTKYYDIVKSEEYLEKIFDISFNMPKTNSIRKLIKLYVDEVLLVKVDAENTVDKLVNFFKTIKFTNPRHLKKVLNKYYFLKDLYEGETNSSIPKGIFKNDVVTMIFVLYFIVIYEYKQDIYEDLKDIKKRDKVYYNLYRAPGSKDEQSWGNHMSNLLTESPINIKKLLAGPSNSRPVIDEFQKLVYTFTPSVKKEFHMRQAPYRDINERFIRQFEDEERDSIATDFLRVLKYIFEENSKYDLSEISEYDIKKIFEFAELYL